MTYIPDLHSYSDEECETKAQELIDPNRRKSIESELEQMINQEFERLEEAAGEFLSQVAARRAECFIEKVIDGHEGAASVLFGKGKGRGHSRWESPHIALRRRLVEAHADLLRNERIKDLESVVKNLEAEVERLNALRLNTLLDDREDYMD